MRRPDWRFVFTTVWRFTPLIVFAMPTLVFGTDLINRGYLGVDFRIYYRATEAWLAGGDPWSVFEVIVRPAHFGAPPASMFPFLPLIPLGEHMAFVVWMTLCAASAVYIVRRLRLGLTYLLFPPLVIGALSGNPDIPLLALLLSGASWAAALASALKVYAVVPLLAERRWRAVAWTGAAFAVMVALAPGLWLDYARRFGAISAQLAIDSTGGFGATSWWPLIPPTVLALLVIARYDLRAAGWLAVPALWPASEWHWWTFAMPVVPAPFLLLLAGPYPWLIAVTVWVYAAWRWRTEVISERTAVPRLSADAIDREPVVA